MEYGDFSLPATHEDKIPTSNQSGPAIKGLESQKLKSIIRVSKSKPFIIN